MRLKKFLIVSLVFIIISSLAGCSKSNDENKVTTLATKSDTVVYYAESSTYFSNYKPSFVLDDDSMTSWVISDDKFGKDEWIKIKFNKPTEVEKLYILNGLGDKSDEGIYKRVYYADNRVKTLEVEFSKGEKQTINLEDGIIDEQEIVLDKIVNTECIKLTIKDVYKGESRPKLTCIGSIGINYPRVDSNDGEKNIFNGIYGEYNKEKDRALSSVYRYIDYNESMDMKQRTQAIADLLIEKYYYGGTIQISNGEDGKLIADLRGERFDEIYSEDSNLNIIDRFKIESNLIQYYYKGEWIKDIVLLRNGEEVDLKNSKYLNKEYIKNNYIDNKTMIAILLEDSNLAVATQQDKTYSKSIICTHGGDSGHLEEITCSDSEYTDRKYYFDDAYDLVMEKIYNNSSDCMFNPILGDYEMAKLCHYRGDIDRLGYIITISSTGGVATATIWYFVDTYTGEIFYYDISSIGEKII